MRETISIDRQAMWNRFPTDMLKSFQFHFHSIIFNHPTCWWRNEKQLSCCGGVVHYCVYSLNIVHIIDVYSMVNTIHLLVQFIIWQIRIWVFDTKSELYIHRKLGFGHRLRQNISQLSAQLKVGILYHAQPRKWSILGPRILISLSIISVSDLCVRWSRCYPT